MGEGWIKNRKGLCLGDFAATQATGADSHTLVAGLSLGVHRTQVDVPAPLGNIVRVTDVISELRTFAADFTNLCHNLLQKIAKLAG
jgi:hypothetical protein